MRRIFFVSTAACALFSATTANAQDTTGAESTEAASGIEISGEIEVASSYIDPRFNDRFSDEPIVKIEFVIEHESGVYVGLYVYSGFDRPLDDKSSEYGFAVGWEGDVGSGVTLNAEAGRYANYQGGGFNAGDWYGLIGFSIGNASFSASVLSGDGDTVALNAAYEIEVAEGFTLRPSLAYLTATNSFYPGITAEVELQHGFALRGSIVFPDTDTGRETYAAAGLVLRF